MRFVFILAICCLAILPGSSHGQPSPLRFKQVRDDTTPTLLTPSELAVLGDPLFNLVLKDRANLVKLADIEAALQPDASKRRLFVISEQIVSRAQTGGRRTVHAFVGTNGGEALQGNVMLSASFGPAGIADVTSIEAWGWDNHRQRYNFYKLDAEDGSPSKFTWRFRASSDRAELLSPAERRGTCLACHVVGAPVMKELFFPWNNWHAGVGASFAADYLDPNSFAMDKWPAAKTPAFKQLTQANVLEEDLIIPALRRFNLTRLNSALKRDDASGNRSTAAGKMTVLEGRRLLRPLFETTDVNLYSSRNTSGIHPLGKPAFVAQNNILMPADQFFLNTDLIAGGGEGKLGGLNLGAARDFGGFAQLTQQENKDLVTKFKVQLIGVSGDTFFAWFVPGVSFVNNDLIDQCLQQGVITPHFLAAALAVDLENPVFSKNRAALLAFIPDQFEFTPVPAGGQAIAAKRDPATDLLTKAVIAKIDAAKPPPGSPAADFRALLNSPDAVKELDRRVKDYANRVKGNLANPAKRQAELERLFGIAIDRRRAMEADPILRNLDETVKRGGLLPLPAVNP
jgi:hypothetical protein